MNDEMQCQVPGGPRLLRLLLTLLVASSACRVSRAPSSPAPEKPSVDERLEPTPEPPTQRERKELGREAESASSQKSSLARERVLVSNGADLLEIPADRLDDARRAGFEPISQAEAQLLIERSQEEKRKADEAAARVEAKSAPPWYCWSGSLVVDGALEHDDGCNLTEERCRANMLDWEDTGGTATVRCKPQPLAACFEFENRLSLEVVSPCFATYRACERGRVHFTDEGGLPMRDYSRVTECATYPSTWIRPRDPRK